jgi:hypothetical protein
MFNFNSVTVTNQEAVPDPDHDSVGDRLQPRHLSDVGLQSQRLGQGLSQDHGRVKGQGRDNDIIMLCKMGIAGLDRSLILDPTTIVFLLKVKTAKKVVLKMREDEFRNISVVVLSESTS